MLLDISMQSWPVALCTVLQTLFVQPSFPSIPIPCTLESAYVAEVLFWSTFYWLVKLCMDCHWVFDNRMGQCMAGGDTKSYKVTRYGTFPFCDIYLRFPYLLV